MPINCYSIQPFVAPGWILCRFQAIYQACHAAVLGYVVRRTANPDDAADVIAETFLTCWRPPRDRRASATLIADRPLLTRRSWHARNRVMIGNSTGPGLDVVKRHGV